MSRHKPKAIVLTDRQHSLLDQIRRQETSTQQQVRRTHVILAATENSINRHIANPLQLTLKTIRLWRQRVLSLRRSAGRDMPHRPRLLPG